MIFSNMQFNFKLGGSDLVLYSHPSVCYVQPSKYRFLGCCWFHLWLPITTHSTCSLKNAITLIIYLWWYQINLLNESIRKLCDEFHTNTKWVISRKRYWMFDGLTSLNYNLSQISLMSPFSFIIILRSVRAFPFSFFHCFLFSPFLWR